MRTLYILRHGKTQTNSPSGEDHDRDLTERGRAAAATIGSFLTRADEAPELILVSSAVRARRTVELAVDAGQWNCPVEVDPALYTPSPKRVIQIVQGHDADAERILIAGHEPWCSELIGVLTQGSAPLYPTGTLARVDVFVDRWSQLGPASGRLAWLLPVKLAQRTSP